MDKKQALQKKKKDLNGEEEIEKGVQSFEKRFREGKMKLKQEKKPMPRYEDRYHGK